jgi:hypothetical protein
MDSYSDIDFQEDLSRIPEPAVVRVVRFMQMGQSSILSNQATVITLLSDMKKENSVAAHHIASLSSTVSVLGSRCEFNAPHPPRAGCPSYPIVIHASAVTADVPSPSESGSSGFSAIPSSYSSSDLSGPHTELPFLQCPFCPHRHTNEKSHCQHLQRLLKR